MYLTIAVFAVVAIFISELAAVDHRNGHDRGSSERHRIQNPGYQRGAHEDHDGRPGRVRGRNRWGLLAITLGDALTSNYATLGGEVWLVILVTYGIRSNGAAVYAGLSLTLLSGVSLAYLPKVFDNFVVIGFGLGAITIVKFPDGILTFQARQVRAMMAQIRVSSPLIYSRLKVGGAAGLVAVVALSDRGP